MSMPELLDMVQDVARIGIWTWNPKSHRLTWSRTLYDLLGQTIGETPPGLERFFTLIAPEQRQAWKDTLKTALRSGTGFERKTIFVLPSEERRVLQCRARIIRSGGGSPDYVVCVCRDLTEEEQLIRSEQYHHRLAGLGQLAAGVAHELNNPLTYVRSAIEELDSGAADSAEAPSSESPHSSKDLLRELRIGVDRISEIVGDLDALSAPNSSGLKVSSISQMVESSVRIANYDMRHSVTVQMRLQPRIFAHIDEVQLAQVMVHLLHDAAQAMQHLPNDQRRLAIRVRERSKAAVIEVEDTRGLKTSQSENECTPTPPKSRSRRSKKNTDDPSLELIVCKKLVREQGGRLFQEAKNEGLRSTITLPLVPAPKQKRSGGRRIMARGGALAEARSTLLRQRATPQEIEQLRLFGQRQQQHHHEIRPSRLILIDDDPLVLRALRRLFRERPLKEFEAAAELADELSQLSKSDIILCDVMMPQMSGIALYLRLQSEAPAICPRFRFLTGGAISESARLFLASRQGSVYRKPLVDGELLRLRADLANLDESAPQNRHSRPPPPESADRFTDPFIKGWRVLSDKLP
ncbi:MAG: response regulator [Polyangiaceae bacterium]|nr:response regulator [Polyangiaceae bacterium]